MGSIRPVIGVLMCVGSLSCSGGTKPDTRPGLQAAVAVATPKRHVSLACGGGSFSKFRLKNTNARTYTAPFSGSICTLTDKADGVIWVATGEGYGLQDADKNLSFKDEQGRQLGHTCWTSSGTINDVTQTELILFGPPDSKKITACCGDSCADAEVQ